MWYRREWAWRTQTRVNRGVHLAFVSTSVVAKKFLPSRYLNALTYVIRHRLVPAPLVAKHAPRVHVAAPTSTASMTHSAPAKADIAQARDWDEAAMRCTG